MTHDAVRNEPVARRSRGAPGPRGEWRHPVNRALVEQAPLGQRIADRVTSFLGSWTFIVLQTVIVAVWVAGNLYLLFNFDPYPFIFLNLAFSTQAAYAAPLILLASNRASVRDRMTLEHAAMQTDVEERQNERLQTGMTDVLVHVQTVEERNLSLEQRILDRERGILTRIDLATGAATATTGSAGTASAASSPAESAAPARSGDGIG